MLLMVYFTRIIFTYVIFPLQILYFLLPFKYSQVLIHNCQDRCGVGRRVWSERWRWRVGPSRRVPRWSSRVGPSRRVPRWSSRVDPSRRVPRWSSRVSPSRRVPRWNSRVGPSRRVPRWSSRVGLSRRVPRWSSRVGPSRRVPSLSRRWRVGPRGSSQEQPTKKENYIKHFTCIVTRQWGVVLHTIKYTENYEFFKKLNSTPVNSS